MDDNDAIFGNLTQKGLKGNRYHFTIDIDWAPDWCVMEVAELLAFKNIKATFFVTHESDVIKELATIGHNIGIHPNFLPNSSQGSHPLDIIENLLKIAPEATCLRTHALYQSSPLFFEIFGNYRQLQYDFSIYMHKFPFIDWFDWKVGDVGFNRINYNFEDDAFFYEPGFNWASYSPWCEMIIFDFHPIHLSLNSSSDLAYCHLKAAMDGLPLWRLKKTDIERHRMRHSGAKDYLEAILASASKPLSFLELL